MARPGDVDDHHERRRGRGDPQRGGLAARLLSRTAVDHAQAIRLRQARLDAGLSVGRAARALQMTEAALRDLEEGVEPVRSSLLVRAARVYGAAPSAMLPRSSDLRLGQVVAAMDASERAGDLGSDAIAGD